MTNPDREELVKIEARIRYEIAACETLVRAPTMLFCVDDLRLILRRLASSDGGVKGEPVAWRYRAQDKADHREWSYTHRRRPHEMDGWQIEDLYTAPPADAGMREALGWLIEKDDPPVYHLISADYDEQWTGDASRAVRFARKEDALAYVDHVGWTTPPVRVVEHMWPALTAPGATTKSDGGSRTAPESCQNCFNEDDCANVDICNAVNDVYRPSDHSSIRSDVMVEELAKVIEAQIEYDIHGVTVWPRGERPARALLDQFEIRSRQP